MKKKLFCLLLCLTAMLLTTPETAYADMGPKPSVVLDFEGLEGQNYYVTLLSSTPSTGPYSSPDMYSDEESYTGEEREHDAWSKFAAYQDKDGYYFLQYFSDCTDTSQFIWSYYPPKQFKILLYFPELSSFAVSEKTYQQYAFDSYYKIDATALELLPDSVLIGLEAHKNYDYTLELVSLFCRIIATIAIELLIALLFGFRAKKQLLIIGAANIATQSLLNILLNIINFNLGSMAFVFNYVWMEILVFAVEAKIYTGYLPQYSQRPDGVKKSSAILYAFTANAVSFAIGMLIARVIPGIF